MTEDSSIFESPTKFVEWRIKKFTDLPTKGNFFLDSPCFSLSSANWFLQIYPNGDGSDCSGGWISVYLFTQTSTLEYSASIRIGILNVDGSEFKVSACKTTFSPKCRGYGFKTFVQRSILLSSKNTLDSSGSLSVMCSLRINEQRILRSNVEAASQTLVTPNVETASQTLFSDGIITLTENLKDMFLKRRFTDVTIVVESREFLAHKFLLASRSSVFAAMFDNVMVEKLGVVEVNDCDPDAFEEFLLFLYSGDIDFSSSCNAVGLYNISDKYDVQELKYICKDRIKRELSIDSFCDVIHLATMHNESDLLKDATDFFIDNADGILSTTKWIMFLEENPALGNELFIKLLKTKRKKK